MNREAPNPAGLDARKLALIERLLAAEGTLSEQRHGIQRRRDLDAYPLSAAQRRMWFLDLFEGGIHYNESFNLRLRGSLDVPTVRLVLQEILRRHEVTRSVIVVVEGQPVQHIAPVQPVSLPVTDLGSVPESHRLEEATRLAGEEARKPFDLTVGPTWRFALLSLDATDHLLLVTAHHISIDGWSCGVFLKEFGTLYEAYRAGRNSALPEPVLQYADYAAWQGEDWQEDPIGLQLEYWKRRLADAPPVLELPADRARGPVPTFRGAKHFMAWPKALSAALRDLSRRHGVTTFMVLLAAFQTLIKRYSEREDVIVGAPIANRTQPEVEGVIGLFINTLILRNDLSGDPTFSTLLQRVRETTLGAFENQDLPLEMLVDALRLDRTEAHSPLFQILFIYRNTPRAFLVLSGLSVEPFEIDNGTAKFDLTLSLQDTADGLTGWFEYATDLFDAARIARMAGHFQVLLEGIVVDSDRRLSELPLLTAQESRRLLVEWNDTKADYPAGACIHELFEAQAKRTPESVVSEFEGESLTYADLDVRSNRLARRLHAFGVGPDVPVALYVDRSLDMVIALLGILKAGGAYLPLDPTFPSDRLAFMLEDARPRVIVTQGKLQSKLPPHQLQVVCVDETPAVAEARPFGKRSSPSDLAYVLYTSGSTGKPKGVQVSHQAAVNFISAMRASPGMNAGDTLLSVTTISFDILGLEIWLPLATGAKVVIASREMAMDGQQLAAIMARCKATVMQATPATWRLLLESGWKGNPHLKILCGGEAWSEELAAALLTKCDTLWNMYGPTETTIWSATHQVTKGEPVLIGRPIANTQFYVVDSRLHPVPVGVPGELLIGGVGLARGYLNRPELTAEKFVPNPFGADPGSRLYRTGDVVRYHPDGRLEFMARVDTQVKIRGFRIELGEIESVLRARENIKDVAVVARDEDGAKRLIAYLVLSGDAKYSSGELRDFLKEKLPDYMIPTGFVVLPEFPLTPNGKVDRKALPLPAGTAIQSRSPSSEPGDILDRQLVRVWEKVLHVHPVAVTDDFFDLGGHSFAAVQLFSEINKLTGKLLPLATIFQAPTVEKLAKILRTDGWVAPWSPLVPLNASGSKPALFLMHSHGGNVLEYYPLAQRLGNDRPVYALQARGLDGRVSETLRIEEMASFYLKEIRLIQPSGPYHLGGFCFGGVLAIEAARQLLSEGERMGMVVLINTDAKAYWEPFLAKPIVSRMLCQMGTRMAVEWSILTERRRRSRLTHLAARGQRAKEIVQTRAEMLLGFLSAVLHRPVHRHSMAYIRKRVKTVHSRAWDAYDPKPYEGKVLLFPAKCQPLGVVPDRLLGWGELLTGQVQVHEIPGFRQTILSEPNVDGLASVLASALDLDDRESPRVNVDVASSKAGGGSTGAIGAKGFSQ